MSGLQRFMRRARDQRGAALVEFALVSIVFFTIVFGIMEFGRMIFDYNIVSTVARDGARWASVRGSTSGHAASVLDVQTYVASRSVGLLTPSDVTPTWPDPGAGPPNAAGKTVHVNARYTFAPIILVLLPSTARTLSSTATMVIVR